MLELIAAHNFKQNLNWKFDDVNTFSTGAKNNKIIYLGTPQRHETFYRYIKLISAFETDTIKKDYRWMIE